MNRFLISAALVIAITPALAADVGVSVSIGQPGFYGRLDVGDYPPPLLIYQQPRYVQRSAVEREPIYLRVPPGHAKNWRKHCYKYDACGERVYFVRDSWYQREYVPRYQERNRGYDGDRRDRYDDRRGNGRGNGRENSRESGNDRGERSGGEYGRGYNR